MDLKLKRPISRTLLLYKLKQVCLLQTLHEAGFFYKARFTFGH